MGNFFQELARRLAERWVGLLVLPGALFAATAWAGWHLGWRDAWDLPGLAPARDGHRRGDRALASARVQRRQNLQEQHPPADRTVDQPRSSSP